MTDETPESLPDPNLPARLFATNRYPTGRLNAYSRPDLIAFVQDKLKNRSELQIIKDSQFGGLFQLPIYLSAISGKLVHGLISRQLVTRKRYELWTVYGGQPLRFSLTEFSKFSGLKCTEFPDQYDPTWFPKETKAPSDFWVKLIGPDPNTSLTELGLKLNDLTDMPSWQIIGIALILLVNGVLIASHQYHKPTPKYVDMVEDVDNFLTHPWGRESFLKTIAYLKPPERINGLPADPLEQFRLQLKRQKTFCLKGFPLILQLTAFNSIPLLLEKIPCHFREQLINELVQVPTIPKLAPLKLEDIEEIENNSLLYVRSTWDTQLGVREGWAIIDTEYNDKKVDYLESLINGNHTFTIGHWHGGDISEPFKSPKPPKKNLKQKQHINKGKRIKPQSKLGVNKTKSKKKSSNRKQKVVTDYFTRSRTNHNQAEVAALLTHVQELHDQLESATRRISRLERAQKKSLKRLRQRIIYRGTFFKGAKKHSFTKRHRVSSGVSLCESPLNTPSTQTPSTNHESQNSSTHSKFSPTTSKSPVEVPFENAYDGAPVTNSVEPLYQHESPAESNQIKEGQDLTPILTPIQNTTDEKTCEVSIERPCEQTEIIIHSQITPQPTLDICPQKRRKEDHEYSPPIKKSLLQDELVACSTQLFKQGYKVVQSVKDNVEAPANSTEEEIMQLTTHGEDMNEDNKITYISDSSPPHVQNRHVPNPTEDALANMLISSVNTPPGELTTNLDNELFAAFKTTLEANPEVHHITNDNFAFDNAFLLVLATPEAWISTLHMEVMLAYLGQKHAQILQIERSYFASPWLSTHITGKYRSFKAAYNKDKIRIDARITAMVTQPGQTWLEDVDTVYSTMIWGNQHWVGLAINLKLAYIEVLDPDTTLYSPDDVGEFMTPLTEMLPHIIDKACNQQTNTSHLSKTWSWKRDNINDKITLSGNCGPIALKLLELHLYGDPPPTMAGITDDMIAHWRKEYALELYKDKVLPIYKQT